MTRALYDGFLRSSERHPERPALQVQGRTLSYAELAGAARGIAATLQRRHGDDTGGQPLTAVFAYRSVTAFAGVLGSLLAGHGYVPLNRTFPLTRSLRMLESSGCRSLIVDEGSEPQLAELLEPLRDEMLVLLPDRDDVADLQRRWPRHTFLGAADLAGAADWQEPVRDPDALAYLLFTSGSTGIPKGVMVAQRNVIAFVDYIVERYDVTPEDRFSQMFDMTFDLSVFDMFVCWERGALLCCPSQKELISPARFITDSELTIWFSVPSTAVFMKRLGLLKPDRYPSLRLSLFCGEPLPVSVAEAWLQAAPNGALENLYGPTELTIACTYYRWDAARSPGEAELDIVPIGHPFPGMDVLVAGEDLREVAPGEEGELLMNGAQMTPGYWRDPDKTAAAFVVPPGRSERYYRTGDRVRRPLGDGPLTHLGRVDFQVKIRGHRAELGEIEAVVRRVSGLDGVVAVPWPRTESGYGAVEVFVEGPAVDAGPLRHALTSELPDYMVPKRFHFLDRLPKNVNDKFDRPAMAGLLEDGL
jgi:amino acid adenylation domain-containing protein